MCPKDILKHFYKEPSPYPRVGTDANAVCAYGDKLGEIILLSRIPLKAQSERKNIYTFVNPENRFKDVFYKYMYGHVEPPINAKKSAFHPIVENRNTGPGNILQQVYSALGLSVDIKPRGFLGIRSTPKKNKVGIHIDGVSAGNIIGFPKLRTIYPENVTVIQKFILDNPQYEFVQFGLSNELQGVTNWLGKSVEESIEEAATCEFIICLNSAFLHIATALDVKTVCIINAPDPEVCFLPVMRNYCYPCVPPYNLYDIYWLPPQVVYLHQDGENPLVPSFSEDNLKKALDGRVYPYFSDRYLDLIFEYE